jgi:hypothetical protein
METNLQQKQQAMAIKTTVGSNIFNLNNIYHLLDISFLATENEA